MEDETMDSNPDLDHTGFLLQRLQELKAWQREQEENLLREQDQQMEQLVLTKSPGDNDESDDDTTIDQDLSSLHSDVIQEEQLPSWASHSSSSMRMEDKRPSIDEQPIVPSAKTFEQMLEEQLQTTPGVHQDKDLVFIRRQADPSQAKSFLRRGSGLARYGGALKKSTPQNLRRSKSTGGSKSSLNSSLEPKSRLPVREKLKTSMSCPNVRGAEINNKKSIIKKGIPTLKLKATPTTSKATTARLVLATKIGLKKAEEQDQECLYDSVELSFMGKLEKADKQDNEDLRAFELLEEAACDSSFCSTSSTVKKLIENVSMPSPIPKRSESQTSTPIDKAKKQHATVFRNDETAGVENENADNLMKDIKAFLENKGAIIHDSDSDSDDNTIKDNEDEDNGIMMEAGGPKQMFLNGDQHESWSSDEEEQGQKSAANNNRKNVHFRDEEALSFSPPRVPKHSPSYLIWSIFTKEREERRQKEQQEKRGRDKAKKSTTTTNQNSSTKRTKSADRDSPMSRIRKTSSDYDFETILINAKLAELQKEIEHFQRENATLTSGKRKLQQDRKQLAKDVQEFELQKEAEKKKLEEDRKRLKRDKTLLEKAQKDKRANFDQKAQDESEELQSKVQKLAEELQRKEMKWGPSLAKLQEQVKLLERENQQLHEDNHKLKLKTVSSKISTHLIEPNHKKVNINVVQQPQSSESSTPDSGCPKNEGRPEVKKPEATRTTTPTSASEEKNNSSPPMAFSPADSLDSEMTLVSASTALASKPAQVFDRAKGQLALVDLKKNDAKGTTEKTFSDGSVEIVYTNGNRKEISSDSKTTKVYYYNGDVKESLASGLVKYFYSQTHTWHLTYPDGKEVLQFSNGQEEIRYPNGTLQISFADGSVKRIDTDGTENIKFPDGTNVVVQPNGDRTLLLPSGQKEIHTATFKRREYPDGTVKILHEDGKSETRYTSGRVRIKDRDGKLLHDSNQQQQAVPIKV